MEQFSLEKYLENPSRKVVTRRGNPVRIICSNRKHGEDTLPIVFLEESPDGIGEFLLSCRADGTCDNYDTMYDLFFADEEEGLTNFEKAVQNILNEPHFQDIEAVKQFSKTLLDLARKELEEKYRIIGKDDSNWEDGYKQGKQDAFKNLPTLKKANDNLRLNAIVPHLLDDVLYWKGYYIWMKDLEKLPKEEK